MELWTRPEFFSKYINKCKPENSYFLKLFNKNKTQKIGIWLKMVFYLLCSVPDVKKIAVQPYL